MADPRPVASRRGPPLPDIQRALAEQYTDKVSDIAQRYAEQRAARVRRAGWPIPMNYAEELVHDAITSIWLGARHWDPQRMTLIARLCSLIKDRTWHEIKRAQRRQHVSFDLAANDAALDADVEGSLAFSAASDGDCPPIMLVALVRRVVHALREIARDSDETRAILACWEEGLIERDEVVAVTGLAELAYDAARQRILRLSKRLPADLREAAQNLLRSAS